MSDSLAAANQLSSGASPGVSSTDQDAEDEPFLSRRRRIDAGDLDITPMIDVTFLLLIFFMVSSTMQEPASANLPPARHGVGIETQEAINLTLRRDAGGGDAVLLLPDGSRHSLTVPETSEVVVKMLRAELAANPPKNHVILNADRDLPFVSVRKVTQMVGQVEGMRLSIAVSEK